MRSNHYAAIVAGSGPAGLAVVGNLLENKVRGRILWVDPYFTAGRLDRSWREVPSNTKAHLFVDYAKALESFRRVLDNRDQAQAAVEALEELDPNKGCSIAYAADMCNQLTRGLVESGEVEASVGRVTGANWNSHSSSWTVEKQHDGVTRTMGASRLVLCIGSVPREIPIAVPDLRIQKISLDAALAPSRYLQELSANAVIGVVGASHSAILVLLNLYNLALTTHPGLRIKWFTRSSLLYAEYKKDYILYDNTGLKGQAADFARKNLEDAKLPHSPVSQFIEKIDCSKNEQRQYERHLPICDHLVQATGFATNPMPMLFRDGAPIQGVKYDHTHGGFHDEVGRSIKGLYGAGIAFPEQITDPEGNVEMSVGLWKFMRYLRRVAKEWTKDDITVEMPASSSQQDARL